MKKKTNTEKEEILNELADFQPFKLNVSVKTCVRVSAHIAHTLYEFHSGDTKWSRNEISRK